ncbi:MAG: MecR1 antirepressor protein [Caulobacteraceae bacterium]|nr:MecR1 antirepressor protein [Caulobacteraceae bacterium]
MKTAFALTVLMFVAGAAQAQPVQLVDPGWVKKPSLTDIERFYPSGAKRAGTQGHVVLNCTADDKGMMASCVVAEEDPTRAGFGAAALKLAPKFQMPLVTKDGTSTAGATVSIPIEFKIQR